MRELIIIFMSAILVENFVLSKFLGICPFLGVSKKLSTAVGMSASVTFVMVVASAVTWTVNHFVLSAFNLEYLQTITFILVIATLVQMIETIMKKTMPPLYKSLGIFLPLITTNCAVLGVALINIQRDFSLLKSVIYSFGAGLGFTLALVLFAGVRERIEQCDVPESLKGLPITLIAAALVSVAFFGFQDLFSNI